MWVLAGIIIVVIILGIVGAILAFHYKRKQKREMNNKVSSSLTLDDMLTENSRVMVGSGAPDDAIKGFNAGETYQKNELHKRLAVESALLKGKSRADKAKLLNSLQYEN